MSVSPRSYAIAGLSFVAIVLVATYALTRRGGGDDPFAECRTTVLGAGGGQIGGPFTLTNENGAQVTEADVLKGPSLVYFGYTFCPDVCPVDTVRNAEAVDILEERGYQVTPVFISVDPRRDTPDVLRDWTDNIHPRMIGLTGTPEQIKAVAQTYKTVYSVPQDPENDLYTVDHMTMTYLMLPGTGFAEIFARDVPADRMADSVGCFLEKMK